MGCRSVQDPMAVMEPFVVRRCVWWDAPLASRADRTGSDPLGLTLACALCRGCQTRRVRHPCVRLWPREPRPRGDVKEKGSAGAEALRSCSNLRAALQRPRRLLPCRGCDHIVSGPSVRPGELRPSLSRPGPPAAAPQVNGAPLRDGLPCSLLPDLHSLDPRPRNLRLSLSLASDARDGTDACLNRVTAPAPQSRSADTSHVDRGERSVVAAERAGISFFRHPSPLPACGERGSCARPRRSLPVIPVECAALSDDRGCSARAAR